MKSFSKFNESKSNLKSEWMEDKKEIIQNCLQHACDEGLKLEISPDQSNKRTNFTILLTLSIPTNSEGEEIVKDYCPTIGKLMNLSQSGIIRLEKFTGGKILNLELEMSSYPSNATISIYLSIPNSWIR